MPNEDKTLAEEIRLIDLESAPSPEYGVIRGLMNGPSGALMPVLNPESALRHVYIVQDTAFVDISLEKPQDTALFARACARTLYEAFNVSYLILTVDGHMPADADGPVKLCNPQKEEGAQYAILLFPDMRGQYIIPAVRRIADASEQIGVRTLFDALRNGPSGTQVEAAMGGDVRLERFSQADETLELFLRVPEGERVHLYGYACLAMSMLGNISAARRVHISENGQPVRDVPGIGEEGIFTAESIADILGGQVTLYFAAADGLRLERVTRSVPLHEAGDPLTAVREMLRGPLDTEKSGVLNILPAGVEVSDALSIGRDDNLAVLDLSEQFFQACADLPEEAEKLLLYSMVNALTERADIHFVLFLREGANVQTLGGFISLFKPLIRNPGIIAGI